MTQHTDQERAEFEAWLPNAYRQPQEVYTVHNMEVAFIAGMQASRRSQTVPHGWKPVPIELLERIQESLGSFLSDQGWSQSDMDTADALGWLLATVPELPAQPGWCDGCSPDNCGGCGIEAANTHHHTRKDRLSEGEKAEQALNFAVAKPVGAFVRGRFGDRVTFHRDCSDKARLQEILDENLSGGPYSAEYAYTESQVRDLLATAQPASQVPQNLLAELERIAEKYAWTFQDAGTETYAEQVHAKTRKAKQALTTELKSALATHSTQQGMDAQDAARYQALVKSGNFVPSPFDNGIWGLRVSSVPSTKAELDAAVDRVIAAQAKQGGAA